MDRGTTFTFTLTFAYDIIIIIIPRCRHTEAFLGVVARQ